MVLAGATGPIIGGRLADRMQGRWPVGRPATAAFLLGLVLASKAIFYGLMGRLPLPSMVIVGVIDAVITMTPIPIYFSMAQDVVPVRLKSMSVGLFCVIVFLTGGAWGRSSSERFRMRLAAAPRGCGWPCFPASWQPLSARCCSSSSAAAIAPTAMRRSGPITPRLRLKRVSAPCPSPCLTPAKPRSDRRRVLIWCPHNGLTGEPTKEPFRGAGR
jgi:hypothetical protein